LVSQQFSLIRLSLAGCSSAELAFVSSYFISYILAGYNWVIFLFFDSFANFIRKQFNVLLNNSYRQSSCLIHFVRVNNTVLSTPFDTIVITNVSIDYLIAIFCFYSNIRC
jgi:hypothetical protein